MRAAVGVPEKMSARGVVLYFYGFFRSEILFFSFILLEARLIGGNVFEC